MYIYIIGIVRWAFAIAVYSQPDLENKGTRHMHMVSTSYQIELADVHGSGAWKTVGEDRNAFVTT